MTNTALNMTGDWRAEDFSNDKDERQELWTYN